MQFRLGKKLERKDKDLNFSALKSEVVQSLKEDDHYTNVDNAKKLAVQQCMDYENFRQLVLGADLKPMKTNEVQTLTSFQNKKYDVSEKPVKLSNIDVDKKTTNLQANKTNRIETIKTFRDFKKIVDGMEKPIDKNEIDKIINSLKNAETANKVVSIDFDAQYLMKLLKKMDEEQYNEYLIEVLVCISKTKNFKNLIKQMLSKNEKALIKKMIIKYNDEYKQDVDNIMDTYCN